MVRFLLWCRLNPAVRAVGGYVLLRSNSTDAHTTQTKECRETSNGMQTCAEECSWA